MNITENVAYAYSCDSFHNTSQALDNKQSIDYHPIFIAKTIIYSTLPFYYVDLPNAILYSP